MRPSASPKRLAAANQPVLTQGGPAQPLSEELRGGLRPNAGDRDLVRVVGRVDRHLVAAARQTERRQQRGDGVEEGAASAHPRKARMTSSSAIASSGVPLKRISPRSMT